MALSALDDKSRRPTEADLTAVLGPSKALWDELVAALAAEYRPLARDWSFAGKKWGWSLRLKHKKRAITYLTPSEGFFMVGFALGEKAVALLSEYDLPSSVRKVIDSAPKYAEGRGVRLEVRDRQDISSVVSIASAKMRT